MDRLIFHVDVNSGLSFLGGGKKNKTRTSGSERDPLLRRRRSEEAHRDRSCKIYSREKVRRKDRGAGGGWLFSEMSGACLRTVGL